MNSEDLKPQTALRAGVNPLIVDYVEKEILPRYNNIGGHTDTHIRQVIARSLRFREQAPETNIDMVYIIAAYHDLGRLVANETHNFESAKMLRADVFISERFTPEQIKIMTEAIEDHRSTLGHEPRSIYGKIVSSADRNTDLNVALERVYDYYKQHMPEASDEEIFEEGRKHLREKYTPNGYAAGTMYFDDPNFAGFLEETERITRTPESFAKAMKKYYKKG